MRIWSRIKAVKDSGGGVMTTPAIIKEAI